MANSQTTVEQELSELGDPSGRQDASYWNQWFNVVCRGEGNRSSFEWYCSADEVLRVLAFHVNKFGEDRKEQRMIHPGSGTSLVPLKLRKVFPHRHVVVDVSEVAIDEMLQVHEKQSSVDDTESSPIEYLVADVLHSQLPFEDESFECWIDKGFVDAIFSKENTADNQSKSRALFQEANRILNAETGIVLVVSLAEDHSLQLLMEAACSPSWKPDIHVWELEPSSGDMRPFGFVFSKAGSNSETEGRRLVWHSIDGAVHKETAAGDDMFDLIQRRIQASREAFCRLLRSQPKSKPVRRILALLEIKPSDVDTDLKALSKLIRTTTWQAIDGEEERTLSLLWQPFDNKTMEKIVPIGFGISKLQLKCILPSEDIDLLIDAIGEREGNDIQSVDVDWENTEPIADTQDFLTGR